MEESHIPSLVQMTPPPAEVLTLDEAKLYLRVDNSVEDDFIAGLISGSREIAENYMKRSLITQTWALVYDDYAPEEVSLPRGPVQSVSNVKLVARDGSETILSDSSYYLSAVKDRLMFDVIPLGFQVKITYVAGYGNAGSAVPLAIKTGMLTHIADLYERRSITAVLRPDTVALYAPFKVVKL